MSNDQNDILRFRYSQFLKEAEGKSPKTLDEAMRALTELEVWLGGNVFTGITADQIVSFKEQLASRASKTTGKPLSATSISHITARLKDFYAWLSEEPEGRKITTSLVAYFTPPRSIRAAARTSAPRRVGSIEEWIAILDTAPAGALIEIRDRAVLGLLLLSGVRDAALISLRRKHLDLSANRLNQDGMEVDTKFGKSIWTSFFPVSEVAREAVVAWVRKLDEIGFGPEDPLFPRSLIGIQFGVSAGQVIPEFWETAGPVRRILQEACMRAGVTYFVPHSVRNTLTRLGIERCKSLRAFKAWSQNLGHNSVATTLEYYGQLRPEEVACVMQELALVDDGSEINELLELLRNSDPSKRTAVRVRLD